MPKLLYQGHASLRLTADDGRIVYIDPYKGKGYDLPADLILVTHQHRDHNQVKRCIRKPTCRIITNHEALAGGKHQRFVLELAHHKTVLVLNNIDIFPRLEPLEIGDRVEFFGEYIWNRHGGAVHWTHGDPKGKRDDGYVKVVTGGYDENVSPISLGVYRHYKGNLYEAIGLAVHSETLEDMVIYKALYGERKTWVRPLSMWEELVEVGGEMIKRFSEVE